MLDMAIRQKDTKTPIVSLGWFSWFSGAIFGLMSWIIGQAINITNNVDSKYILPIPMIVF